MSALECILLAVVALASGGFWLGYVFLKEDAKVKLAHQKGGEDVAALRDEIAQLRQQLSELRETSIEYDLSLEATLHRLERSLPSSSNQDSSQLSSFQ